MIKAGGELRRVSTFPGAGSFVRELLSAESSDELARWQTRPLRAENLRLREEIADSEFQGGMVGSSPALKRVLRRVDKVAATSATVLITGETGTGKELIARAIHRRSARSSAALVKVNCAALPGPLLASELFGHEKGAFTGAWQRHLGRFELAHQGTLFLDEVAELPLENQGALLRILQDGEFERVGGSQTLRSNVRLIAATNRMLAELVESGAFRSDLFYRLNVFPIEVPPLRERSEDIPLLVEYYAARFSARMGKRIRTIGKRNLDLLTAYSWPGNIRELENIVERAVILTEGEQLLLEESALRPRHSGQRLPEAPQKLYEYLASQERALISSALQQTGGKISGTAGAAALLGISSTTLDSKIKSLGIDKYRYKVKASAAG